MTTVPATAAEQSDSFIRNVSTPAPPAALLARVDQFDKVAYFEKLHLVEADWHNDEYFVVVTVVFVFTLVVGLSGNLLVIVSHVANSRRGKALMSFFVGLAVSDILFLVVCIPQYLVARVKLDMVGGRFLCKAGWFIDMATTCGSILSLVAVSLERYIVIVHPLKSRSWCSNMKVYRSLVVLWLVACAASTPLLFTQNIYRMAMYNETSFVVTVPCVEVEVSEAFRVAYTWAKFVLMFLLPLLLMLFCYSSVIKVLWKSNKEIDKLTEERPNSIPMATVFKNSKSSISERKSNRSVLNGPRSNDAKTKCVRESRKQVIKMLLVMVVLFFACFAPRYLLNLTKLHHAQPSINLLFKLELTFELLPFIHATLQPIIYSFLSSVFRNGVRLACSSCFKCLRRCCSCGECGCCFNHCNDEAADMTSTATQSGMVLSCRIHQSNILS